MTLLKGLCYGIVSSWVWEEFSFMNWREVLPSHKTKALLSNNMWSLSSRTLFLYGMMLLFHSFPGFVLHMEYVFFNFDQYLFHGLQLFYGGCKAGQHFGFIFRRELFGAQRALVCNSLKQLHIFLYELCVLLIDAMFTPLHISKC